MWEKMQKIDTRHVLKRKKNKRMYISFIRTRGNMPGFLPYDGKISDRILEGNVSTQNYANCQSILLSRTFFSRVFMNLMVVMATRWVRLEILALANFKWRNPLWFMNRAISIEERSSEKAEVCYFIIFIIGLTSLENKDGYFLINVPVKRDI